MVAILIGQTQYNQKGRKDMDENKEKNKSQEKESDKNMNQPSIENTNTNPVFEYELLNKLLYIFKFVTPAFILNVLHNFKLYYNSIKCANFYGIPKEYFYNEPKTELTVDIFVIIVCCIIPFIPYLIKRSDEKFHFIAKKSDAIYYSILIFISIFYILSNILAVNITKNFNTLNSSFLIALFIIILPLIVSLALSFLSYEELIKLVKPNDHNKKGVDTSDKHKNKIDFHKLMYIIFSTIYILMIILLLFDILFMGVEKKKKYEIVKLEDGASKMIISHHEGKVVLMDYISLNQDGNLDESGNNIIIDKGHYSLESIDGKLIEFKKFASVSNDNYESYKKENKTVK